MSSVDQTDELFVGFLDEAMHGLHGLPDLLATYRQCPTDDAPIHAVFRAVHSIKGNAGFFGLIDIKQFSHKLENTLDDLRNDRLAFSEPLERALVDGIDLLHEMLLLVQAGESTAELDSRSHEVLEQIEGATSGQGPLTKEQRIREIADLSVEIENAGLAQSAAWTTRLRRLLPSDYRVDAGADSLGAAAGTCGTSPATLRDARFACGTHDLTAQMAPLLAPFVEDHNPDQQRKLCEAFVSAAIELSEWADAHGQSDPAGRLRDAAENMRTILASPLDLDATLLSIAWDAFAPAINAWVATPQVTSAAESTPKPKEPTPSDAVSQVANVAAKGRFLRVKEEYLEAFVEDVSRLFITCERLKDLHLRMSGEKQLAALVDELKQINATFYGQTNALQSSVVALRNVPAQSLLSKFPRMARTLAGNLGKQLEVVLVGEELGIDKSLVEDLDAPLTHMIRNVCDHAIELPEERAAVGKPVCGKLLLKCELTRTHVVFTIRDDGRGIDAERLRCKAVEKRLLSPDQAAALSPQEAVELIFHPGFSTAEKVTEVSGRGVGMDVVRTTLRDHGGNVSVESAVGVGTTFTLTVPIRNAVLVVDGLLVRHGDANYVVPLEHVREIVEVRLGELKSVHNSCIALVRGEPHAAISLGAAFGSREDLRPEEIYHGLVLKTKEGTLCLLTERVLGQRKVVINSLRGILPGIDKLTGVAQLGGGRLALVISAPDIVREAAHQRF